MPRFWNLISLEGSAIGQGLRQSPRLMVALTAVAIALLVPTLMLTTPEGQAFDQGRGVYYTLATIAALSLGFVVAQVPGMAGALGFRVAPKQGWRLWLWVGIALGVGQFLLDFVVVRFVPAISLGRPEAMTWQRFFSSCLMAPMAEEVLFRMLTCPPAAALTGRWGGILISGVMFASAHYVDGVGSPDNLIGGFGLAWLFLKSETMLVPIALHSLSNLVLMICLAPIAPVFPPAPSVPADKQHAAEGMGIKSLTSTVATTITFVNKTLQTIKVYWLDAEGHRKLIETVKAGDRAVVPRPYLHQPWLITDEDDNAWSIYFADAQPRTVEIVSPMKKH
jgi:membrane protease YdiL (CAAX protease family)